MPRSKSKSKSKQKTNYDPKKLLARINERFPNFLLGLTVFVLVILVGSLFIQNKNISSLKIPQSITKLFRGNTELPEQSAPKTYTVVSGDTLWSIAEEAYGSGYSAYDLAKLNNITDADSLNEGAVLKLPSLEPKEPTRGEIAGGGYTTSQETPQADQPTAKSYTVVSGDSLWSIALKQYGNPYRWTEIQAANTKITNPNLIFAGETLQLPN